jgi:transposase
MALHMAGTTITMLDIRKILQNKQRGLSDRLTARAVGISRTTLLGYLQRLRASGLDPGELLKLGDAELWELARPVALHCAADAGPRVSALLSYLETALPELGHKGVTRRRLWEEYRVAHPEGHGYSQFCEHVRAVLKLKKVTMTLEHHPGDVMMVDFAGDKLSWVDRRTGEVHICEVLVCILPCSGYTFAVALGSQRQEDFCHGIAQALRFYGGVPRSILCDNLKSGVVKSNRYEPVINELLSQLSVHYDTTVMATRPAKPRDKAKVEGAVLNTYRKIYAPLRKCGFHSLDELNQAIRRQLDVLNGSLFQGRDYSRGDAFASSEKASLSPLPAAGFVVSRSVKAKVQMNYHVLLGEDKHFYSVPYMHVGKEATIHYTPASVEVHVGHERVAVHARSTKAHGYSTREAHMPAAHAAHLKGMAWDKDHFIARAHAIGPHTEVAVKRVLEARMFVQQSFNTCRGILRLAGQYGNERLENACRMAAAAPHVSYRFLDNILKHKTDLRGLPAPAPAGEHENLRGAAQYQ